MAALSRRLLPVALPCVTGSLASSPPANIFRSPLKVRPQTARLFLRGVTTIPPPSRSRPVLRRVCSVQQTKSRFLPRRGATRDFCCPHPDHRATVTRSREQNLPRHTPSFPWASPLLNCRWRFWLRRHHDGLYLRRDRVRSAPALPPTREAVVWGDSFHGPRSAVGEGGSATHSPWRAANPPRWGCSQPRWTTGRFDHAPDIWAMRLT